MKKLLFYSARIVFIVNVLENGLKLKLIVLHVDKLLNDLFILICIVFFLYNIFMFFISIYIYIYIIVYNILL
jgi:hypothetical protein